MGEITIVHEENQHGIPTYKIKSSIELDENPKVQDGGQKFRERASVELPPLISRSFNRSTICHCEAS